jgi:hypothetical protein
MYGLYNGNLYYGPHNGNLCYGLYNGNLYYGLYNENLTMTFITEIWSGMLRRPKRCGTRDLTFQDPLGPNSRCGSDSAIASAGHHHKAGSEWMMRSCECTGYIFEFEDFRKVSNAEETKTFQSTRTRPG